MNDWSEIFSEPERKKQAQRAKVAFLKQAGWGRWLFWGGLGGAGLMGGKALIQAKKAPRPTTPLAQQRAARQANLRFGHPTARNWVAPSAQIA